MKFNIIGIPDRPAPFFPPEVAEEIRRGRVFSGGRRHHELVGRLLPAGARWIDITVPLDDVFAQYRQLGDEAHVTVFASGDPLFFGFANTIRERMPEAAVQLFPAFNSLQMLAHRLVMPYHDMRIVSLTGRPWPDFDRALIERTAKIGVLTDREHTPAAIARRMTDYGFTGYRMHVGEHLGHPDRERITTLTLSEAAAHEFSHPNCLILEATAALSPRPFGIPDSDFALLDGRERMITKMPIRLLSLQALDLSRRHVLWDIGFCTGSISIEARLLFPHLRIEAFEIRPECEAIIRENMCRHHAPGIAVHMGDFLSGERRTENGELATAAERSDRAAANSSLFTLHSSLPTPDAVFIGGHGGQLKAIMAKVASCLAPGGVIVMNSVTPASRQLFAEACAELGLRQLPTMHIALNDYNPIDILKCEQPS